MCGGKWGRKQASLRTKLTELKMRAIRQGAFRVSVCVKVSV